MKHRVFIGSSKESEEIAITVSEFLSGDYECVVWNNGFFGINKGTYESLAKNAVAFDYAIYIGGKDDLSVRLKSRKVKISPRDNVYLELGLYAGILSPARSYFLIDEKCKIASDLLGITVLRYSNSQSLRDCCAQIKEKMWEESKLNRIQLLPSTSLAIGYFKNFLQNLEYILTSIDTIDICGHTYSVKNLPQSFEVIIPDTVDADWASWAVSYKKKHQLKEAVLNSQLRKVVVLLDNDALTKDQKLRLLDIPQTLRASFQAVDLVLGIDYIGRTAILDAAKKKEVNNFILTLNNMIKSCAHISSITTIRISSL